MSAPREETGLFRTADGTRLAWTRRRTGARRLIVVSPGVLMDRGGPEHRLLAERLCGIADVLTLDTRSHGDSGGTFTYGVREPADLAALARSLRPEYDRLGGLGFSYGGFHTIVAAARDGVFDAVAVVGTPHHLHLRSQLPDRRPRAELAPPPPPPRRTTRLGLWPRGIPAVPSRLVGRIAPRPLLVAHGADDWLIPPSHARRLRAAAGEPKNSSPSSSEAFTRS